MTPDRVRVEWEIDGQTHAIELTHITASHLTFNNGVREAPTSGMRGYHEYELDGTTQITLNVSGTRTLTEPS